MTVTLVRDDQGHPVVQTVCRECEKPLSLPCKTEEGKWLEPTQAALHLAGLIVCTECYEADQEERARRELERSEAERVRAAKIPENFRNLKFEDMDRTGQRDRAVTAAQQWAHAGSGLLVWGVPGTGKTRLAATAIRARLRKSPATWCSVAHLVASLEMAFSAQERQEALRLLIGNGALVLDDLDKVRPSESVLSHLFVAIDRRVAAGAPLFVTSNAPPIALNQRFGEAITSRLLGYCLVVELGGQDRRMNV